MDPVRIALIGAGSRAFGPAMVRDVLWSEPLRQRGIELVLMDIAAHQARWARDYAEHVNRTLDAGATLHTTTDLDEALEGADFAVAAIEIEHFKQWAMDFHVPRWFDLRQVFGENGGVGGIFHALRNMGPTVHIARTMERRCPDGVFLNFTNPLHKLCEAVTRLTNTRMIGLCHGVGHGMRQIAELLGRPIEELELRACGINHFTFFQVIRDAKSGEDLYPALREAERRVDWRRQWHDLALGRVLFRRFGLWPSPASNHYGEYIGWSEEFVASELQFFYDPADGHPWQSGEVPPMVYTIDRAGTEGPLAPPDASAAPPDPQRELEALKGRPIEPSPELARPIMESLACGVEHELEAVNLPNRGYIPNLPERAVVEVPARADGDGLRPTACDPLPEPLAAMMRTQCTIHQLLVEAFAEQSRDKLLQAVLLDPTAHSYRRAVAMVDLMLDWQGDLLPPLK